jgi:hypothetical protein
LSIKWLFNNFKWNKVLDELNTDFWNGFNNPTPFMYFLSIIVFCGGIGVFISFYKGNYDIANIATYIFALMSSLVVDLFLKDRDCNGKSKDMLMCIICFCIFIMSLTLISVSLNESQIILKWYIVFISLLSTWYLWWILSSGDSKLKDKEPTREDIRDSTIGSDPSASLIGKGLSDFRRKE